VAMAQSSGGVAIRYVLPVLWMMSHLAVVGTTPKPGGFTVKRRPCTAWQYQGGVWCLRMLVESLGITIIAKASLPPCYCIQCLILATILT